MVPLGFLLSPRGQSRLNARKLPRALLRFYAWCKRTFHPSLTLLLIVRDVSAWLVLCCVAVMWWLDCCWQIFLRTTPGGAGCAFGRSVAFGTRVETVLDRSTRDCTDRPLSFLSCYTWDSDTPIRDLASRNRRALLDNSTRDRTDRPLSLLACYTRYSPGVTLGLSWYG